MTPRRQHTGLQLLGSSLLHGGIRNQDRQYNKIKWDKRYQENKGHTKAILVIPIAKINSLVYI